MKKLLALVLALVMSMSLVTISNAAYSDKADIDLKEAVDVLSAVGVFEGSDGKFDPKANLTREQAAKLVAYLQLGQKSADALVGGNKFTDVAANRWSAGYVDYCATTGVVAGVGNGQFNPTGSLTALQFGKMLLVCLGYDAKTENLTGSDWQINTSKLMTSAKLLKGLDSVKANDVITREQAAQMMLNAIKAPTVEYDTKGSTITIGDTVIGIGGSKATYVTATVAEDKSVTNIGKTKLTNSNAYTVELGEKLFSTLKLGPATDAFERPASKWTIKSTEIGTYVNTPDLTYTETVKLGTIYSDLALSDSIKKGAVEFVMDGAASEAGFAADGTTALSGLAITKGNSTKIGGNGVLVEVYYDDVANTAKVILVNTYAGEVTSARAKTASKDANVTVTPMNAARGGVYETEDFKVDDAVTYNYSNKAGDTGVKNVAKAEQVTGTLTGYSSSSVVVGGTTYKFNKAASISSLSGAVDKEVTLTLDKYGFVLDVDASATSTNYAVVLKYSAGAGDFNDTPKVKLLFTDGTTKTVEIAFANVGTVGSPAYETCSTFDAREAGKINKYDIVSYTVDSDKVYTLKLVADGEDGYTGGGFSLTNGSNSFGIVDNNAANINVTRRASCHNADGKTIFLVADTSGKKVSYSVYEGFANVPTIKHQGGTDAPVVAVYTKDGITAKVVFVEKNSEMNMTTDNKDVVFIKGSSVKASYTTALGTYFEYDAFVNGEEKTVKVTTAVDSDTLVYGPSYDTKGLLVLANCEGYVSDSHLTAGADMKYVVGTDSVVNEVIKLGGQAYAYASDVNVYYIGVDGKLIASDITAIAEDANDVVFLKTNDKGRLTEVYIRIVDETTTPGAPTSGHYSINLTNSHSSSTATVTVTNDQAASKNVTNVKVTMLNTASGTSATFDLADGSASSSGAYTATFATVNTATYYVTATIDGVTLTSNTVIGG